MTLEMTEKKTLHQREEAFESLSFVNAGKIFSLYPSSPAENMSSRAGLPLSSMFSSMRSETPFDKFLKIDCKSGRIDIRQARFFFNHLLFMSPPPPISWFSMLLTGLAKSKHSSIAISFYKTLNISGALGPRSNPFILNILINCYSRLNLHTAASSALGLVLKNGYNPTIRTFTSLIKGLFAEKKVVDAVRLYSKMGQFGCIPDVYVYNVMIDGLCKNGKAAIALQLHQEMVHGKDGVSRGGIDAGLIRRFMPDNNLIGVRIYPDAISYNCLIDGLCRSGMEDDAKCLFSEMIDRDVCPNVITYSILINSLCKKGKLEQAKEILDTMKIRGEFLDTITYSAIVDGYCKIGKVDEALDLYNDMNCRGITADTMIFNSLLMGLFRAARVLDARSLFNEMKKSDISGGCRPCKVTYSVMIDGLCKEGDVDCAKELFQDMRVNNIYPHIYVYCSLIDGLCRQENMDEAQELFMEMLDAGVRPNEVVYNALIDGFIKGRCIDKAKELFLQMKSRCISPNVVTYSSLINGLYHSGNEEEAKLLFEGMIGDGIMPDVVTFSIIMKYLCKEGCIEQAVKAVELMTQRGVVPNLVTYNTLIKGLCSEGRIVDAQDVFSLMGTCGLKCDAVTYSTLMHGYCEAGKVEEAQNLFVEMEAKGCFPDLVNFSILISGFARQKEFGKVKELVKKMHAMKIQMDMNLQCVVLECIKEMDDEDGLSWINSLPHFSSLDKPVTVTKMTKSLLQAHSEQSKL